MHLKYEHKIACAVGIFNKLICYFLKKILLQLNHSLIYPHLVSAIPIWQLFLNWVRWVSIKSSVEIRIGIHTLCVSTRGGVEDTRLEAKDTKKSEAKAEDSLSEDRHSRGQGQECSRPRPRTKDTSASALQKEKRSSQKFIRRSQKKKKVFTKIFQAISTKKRFPKNFSSASQNFSNSKNSAVLEPRTGQFSRTWGLEAKDLTFEAMAKDFKMCPRGLHLWYLRSNHNVLCLALIRLSQRTQLICNKCLVKLMPVLSKERPTQ